MKVCIAEKPSVAREIANVLGANSRKDGYFEGNGYQVTWTFGHFCTLWPPEDYKPHWKRWDLQTLPMLPEKFETKVMSDGGVKKQFKIIKSLFKNASLVINCGDAGQEGELIQRWVIKEAKYKVGDYVQMSDVMDEHTSYNDDVFEIVEVDQNLFHDDKRTKSSCYTYKLHKNEYINLL